MQERLTKYIYIFNYHTAKCKIKKLYRNELPDSEKVLIDVKSLYRLDEMKASGMRFWRM